MANSNDVLPVYIGDDRTDEDAFKVNLSTLFFKVLVIVPLLVWQEDILYQLLMRVCLCTFCLAQMVNGMKHGCSILVSTAPKGTSAAYSIRDPSEV
jgi:trehalose 6-phosphate phosphatase